MNTTIYYFLIYIAEALICIQYTSNIFSDRFSHFKTFIAIFILYSTLFINQRDIFQHVPIIFRKPVKPDSMGVPGFSPFGDVHMSFRIPPRLDARE